MNDSESNRRSSSLTASTGIICLLFATCGLSNGQDSFFAESRFISLNEAIRSALSNNTDIQIERLNAGIAEDRIMLAESTFEPVFETSYNYENTNTPQNQLELASTGGDDLVNLDRPRIFERRDHLFDSNVTKRFHLGTEIEVGSRWSQLENTLTRSSATSLFNPEWSSFTGVTFRQPLLRNFGEEVNTATIRVAQTDSEIAELTWQTQIEATVGGVIKRYVDLVAAREALSVRDEAIRLASKLVEDNKQRREVGKMTDVDVQEAEVAVSIRQEERLSSETDYIERQNALRVLIDAIDADVFPGTRIIPSSSLKTNTPTLDRNELLSIAKTNRDDFKIARLEILREDERVNYALNQKKPRLDLLGSAGLNGLDGNVDSAYREAFNSQGPQWSVGVSLSIPLGNRQAKQQLAIARKQADQARLRRGRIDLVVALELDTVIHRVETAQKRYTTARKSSELASAFLEVEGKQLAEGKSTSFELLERQTDVSAARVRELAAIADLNKSLVDVWIVSGQLLDKYGIEVAEDSNVSTIGSK